MKEAISSSRRPGGNRCQCWWPCFVGLVLIFLGRTTAQYCTADGEVEEVERHIYDGDHEQIAYILERGTIKAHLRTHEDLKVRYKRNVDGLFEDIIELDGVPQYFTDLRDRDVERELEYRVKHDRWSDRVILEKFYFGVLFGKSGFPDHYYLGAEGEAEEPERETSEFENADGWDIFDRNENFCEWTGITCHDNKVTEIQLNEFHLKGTLTEDIQYLSDLENLDLQDNELGGTIPTTLSNLNKLKDLNLAINNFNGTIPKQSLRLRNLERLFLCSNFFTGSLPKALLHKLPKLTMFDLSKNKLNGTIPQNYGIEERSLVYMYLESNKLSGKLPEDASGLQSLQVLDAAGNHISGSIPTSWMSLTQLESFSLTDNRLSGTIPTELLNLSNLAVLALNGNMLSGTLPTGEEGAPDRIPEDVDEEGGSKSTWLNLSKLFVILLNGNKLSGTIPSAFMEASPDRLVNLDLAKNYFTGTIPQSIGKLKNLQRFHAQQNRLTGSLPASIIRLSPFLDLNVTGNFLVGSVPMTFCGSGARSQSFLFRQFGCDAILCPPGTFHPSGAATMEANCRPCPPSDADEDHDPPLNRILGRLDCPGTEFVNGDLNGDGDLSQGEILRLLWTYTIGRNWGAQFQTWADPKANVCELNGITCSNGNIAKMDLTDAAMCSDGNQKRGDLRECHGLPAELSLLTDLEILTMSHRQFLHSTIPSEFGRLTKLKYLDVGGSLSMIGTLPSELGLMSSMKILNFSGCRFSGTVPEELYRMTNLEKLHLSMNAFTGTLSPKVGKLTNLKELMWSRSELTGPIPNEIGSVTSLENWELYGNELTGTIPSSLGNCSNLKRIDLFNNNLKGSLPESLTKLSSLQILHIKLNHLTGTIPSGFGDLPFLSWFDISSNTLHGTIPSSFGASRSIKDFRLANNMIHGPIHQSLCTNANINGGLTRTYGCDGVICPLGTFSEPGHATHSEGCKPCPDGGTTLYLGSTSCEYLNDADILAIFFNVMGGGAPNALQKRHWGDPDGPVPCSWNGVKCDEEGEIASIRFPLFGLDDSDYI